MNKITKEVEEFLKTNKKTHFLQSPEWSSVKTEWEKEFIVVKNKEGKISGTMSILLRKMPIFNRYIMYAPRGFVGDAHDQETLEELTNQAKKVAKKYRAFIFRMDPDISNDNDEFKKIALGLGYKMKKNIKNINQVIQPKYVFRLDLKNKTEEDLLKSFTQKTRYNIRLSAKKGVTIREGTRDDLKIFYEIMKKTGTRDDFSVRPLEYFKKIYDAMSPNYAKLIIAEYEGKAISAVLPILYGNKVWYLYGGSSNEHRNLMANYLLQWEMIKWGLNNECDTYDFRGVSGFKNPKDPQYGVYKFKKGFNGEFIEFVNELYIVFNPIMNVIFNFSKWIYNKIYSIKSKTKK